VRYFFFPFHLLVPREYAAKPLRHHEEKAGSFCLTGETFLLGAGLKKPGNIIVRGDGPRIC
jgi:hypothetical protein